MASQAQLADQLNAVTLQLKKVQAELDAALHPPTKTFVISSLQGVFADDQAVAIGDTAHVTVVRGRVGQLNSNGIWNDIDDGTIVEYWTSRGTAVSNKAIEAFYG